MYKISVYNRKAIIVFLQKVMKKFLGDPQTKLIKEFQPLITKINGFESEISALDDDALKSKTDVFKARLKKGETVLY